MTLFCDVTMKMFTILNTLTIFPKKISQAIYYRKGKRKKRKNKLLGLPDDPLANIAHSIDPKQKMPAQANVKLSAGFRPQPSPTKRNTPATNPTAEFNVVFK